MTDTIAATSTFSHVTFQGWQTDNKQELKIYCPIVFGAQHQMWKSSLFCKLYSKDNIMHFKLWFCLRVEMSYQAKYLNKNKGKIHNLKMHQTWSDGTDTDKSTWNQLQMYPQPSPWCSVFSVRHLISSKRSRTIFKCSNCSLEQNMPIKPI